MKLEQLFEKQKLNYTGIFFKNGTHMTWNYGLPLERPEGVESGDKIKVKVIGSYEDEQVACNIIELNINNTIHKTQPNKTTLLHVTTKVENGGKPVMSGQRATKNGYEKITPFYLDGVWN